MIDVISSCILFCFTTDTCAIVNPDDRVDCGWPGISKDQCLQTGCCFDDTIANKRFCYYKPGEVLLFIIFWLSTL